ncbi:MAG: hypothetical protein ACRDHX_05005 [Chloroflexota bacterium]
MRFWPASDPAQLDYERLREMALAGMLLHGVHDDYARFQRNGLVALIRKLPPATSDYLMATLVEVPRPRWSPYVDPRLEALADAYDMLTAPVPKNTEQEAAQ